jgi:hypothetical protein
MRSGAFESDTHEVAEVTESDNDDMEMPEVVEG